MKYSAWQTVMGILLLCIVALISWQVGTLAAAHNQAAEADKARSAVVIDTGHEDNDPDEIGIDGQLEKDTDLEISEQPRAYLEVSDVEVILTRDSDQGFYSSGSSYKKIADMRKRCEIINEAASDLMVNTHQNSYHEEHISRDRIFYHKTSEEGKFLAEILQKYFDYVLSEANKRMVKTNDNYYFLPHVKEPIVIMGHGFPNNRKEAKRLEDEGCQDRMVWTICMGIMEYLSTVKQKHQRPVIRPGNQKNRFKNRKAARVRTPSYCLIQVLSLKETEGRRTGSAIFGT